jgi:dTDP-4-amino-4,6-dideoxygalactose transaminase
MESKYKYNVWPLGKIPKELQRLELDELKNRGYKFADPRDVVDIFEEKVAKFSGSKYAVSVDCCSHGLFLSLKYLESIGELPEGINPLTFKRDEITIPSRTYVSAPMQINQAGYTVKFEDIEWSGIYQLKPTRIWDGAVRWTKDMYVGNNALQVVSFQIKKRIPIGKGGIILTDDRKAYEWLKLARYDGRDMSVPYTDENHILMMGYHMYMTPEDAARGIILMDEVNKYTEEHEDSGNHLNYTDVSQLKIFNK